MNIYEKMLAIQTELQTVAKNLNVETGGGKGYKAVSERDIIDAVKPLEAKYKVYSYPKSRRFVNAETYETETTYKDKTTKKTTFYKLIEVEYAFVNVEKPDEMITMITCGEGIDSQDKGCGKAMTYADKYALMKAYKISTGDDPDQNASTEEYYTKATKVEAAIDSTKVAALIQLIENTKADPNAILKYYGVKKLDDMSYEQWEQCVNHLRAKRVE